MDRDDLRRVRKWKLWTGIAVVLLLFAYEGQVVHAIRGESLTWDEGDHIFAGYESWKTHDFGLNPEHPPMVKMVATIPLLGLPLKVPQLQGRFFKTEAYMDGRELLFHNGPADGGRFDARTLTLRVRLAAGIFGLTAALLVFAAGTEMFGVGAGLCALLLFAFEPNLLAHGAYVTTDMAASCTIFATIYAFWRWVQRPTWARAGVFGLAGGLALAAKHSAVLLVPMLVLLAAIVVAERWWVSGGNGRRDWRALAREAGRVGGVVLIASVIAVVVLWAFYGFRYSARPIGLALTPTLAGYVKPLAPHEAKAILFLGRLHLLPESWLYGLADVRAMANGMPSYFFGRVYEHGVWFYFPVLFTIKSTLGLLALLLLTAVAIARGWLAGRQKLVFLIVPPALYLLVAMDSHLNIGARHILPVWVFCCVLAGAGAVAVARRGRGWAAAVAILLALHVVSTLRAAPNYISYSNEAWGGPTQTYRYLSDSNTDWAQQLVATSAYLRERGIHECWIAYFAAPFLLPEDYGIPCRRLPTFDSISIDDRVEVPPVIDGPVLISAGDLNGFEFGSSVLNPYEAFRGRKPVAFVQDGVFVFEGGPFAVPLASAMVHVQRSAEALGKGDSGSAVQEAEIAERAAPGAVQTELQLGDALGAAGRKAEAEAAYARAEATIGTMDADGQEVWRKTLSEKRAKLG